MSGPMIPSQGHGVSGRCSWYDEIAVERAVNGDPPRRLHRLEIREAVTILTRRRYGSRQIARRLGVAERTVQRHRAALRAQERAA